MKSFTFFIFLIPLLLRALLIPFPHSGQNNHHGSKTAYGGDYEAQRHWMEITYHLPMSQWYKYDLSYWGLDYPPLIAYGSQFMGWLSSTLVGEESVALLHSRGYEDDVHKVFMRGTVMAWDLFTYFPFVYLLCERLVNARGTINDNSSDSGQTSKNVRTMLLWLTVVIQPALVLIDNGHFQYNSVCLGLSLGAFHYMTLHSDRIGWNDIIASVLFCLALNWKQMGLYYSPAVFSYLLGKCFRSSSLSGSGSGSSSGKEFCAGLIVRNISILGSAVIGTFSILWYPFYHYREDTNDSLMEVFGPILRRIFPFSRGLFEGKVANIWCVAAIKPFSIRERIPEDIQPLCALLLTLGMMLPFCICLFLIGKSQLPSSTRSFDSDSIQMIQSRSLKAILWGSAGTSLSFFLASFQVHEKSILLPLAPLSLLLMDQPLLIAWFSLVSAWSLWHLLVTDRLQVVYFLSLVIVTCLSYYIRPLFQKSEVTSSSSRGSQNARGTNHTTMTFMKFVFEKLIVPGSLTAMILLHIMEAFVEPPSNLPDIFPVLWVIVGCLSFVVTWLAALVNIVQLTYNDDIIGIKED